MFLNLYLVLFLQMTIVFSQLEDGEILCSMVTCPTDSPANGQFTSDCINHDGFNLVGHCCVHASSGSVFSIDLSYCNITYIDTLIYDETPDVLKVNFSGNSNLHISNDSLTGLTKLFSLTLPHLFKCPGQWQWFNSTWNSWNKTIFEKKQTRCINQSDTCSLLRNEYNYTCPGEHSKCVNNGPGQFLCLCEDGWNGYKCLRRNSKLVLLAMIPATFGIAVVLSALLWYTERRYVT